MARILFDLPADFVFATDLPVCIHHVQQGGQMDHAQLLTLVSEARVRFFLWLGYEESAVEGLTVLVGDLAVQYRSPGHHGETLRVEMAPQEFDKHGFDLVFRVSEKTSGRELARGKIGLVFTDPATRKVAELPEAFMEQLAVV